MPDDPSSEADASGGEAILQREPGESRLEWGADHADGRQNSPLTLRDLARRGELPSRRHLIAIGLVMALAIGLTALGSVKTNYLVITPGTVQDLRPDVDFAGENAPTVYEPRGDLSLVTVRSGRASPLDRFYAKFRDDIELIPLADARPGGESDDDVRRRDEEMMTTSKDVAEYVALKYLGYPVKITGEGARVDDVLSSTAAAAILKKGDVVKAVDGQDIALSSEIRDAIGKKTVGDEVTLKVDRNGSITEVTLPLSQATDGEPRPVVGIVATTLRPHLSSPVKVEIGTGEIGGPSAGLAFTLEIIDSLTPDDLTGGHKVVATGAMAVNGSVVPVGGVREKAIAAERAGAEYFIVPRDNLKDAKAGTSKVEIIPVSNLEEAVAFLGSLRGKALVIPKPGDVSAGQVLTPTAHP